MTETTLQWIQVLKVLAIAGYVGLYGAGGIKGKWKRRIIGSAFYTLIIAVFSLWTGSFSWWYVCIFPILFGATSMGYGAIFIKDKIIKRGRYGLACAIASLPIFIVQGAWTLLALHIILTTATSIIAGVWNQTSSARAEESLIAASIVLVPMFAI